MGWRVVSKVGHCDYGPHFHCLRCHGTVNAHNRHSHSLTATSPHSMTARIVRAPFSGAHIAPDLGST